MGKLLAIASLLVLGLTAGAVLESRLALLGSADEAGVMPGTTEGSALEHALAHLDRRYVCPMHPEIVREGPASCPICGMDLVSVEARGPGEPRPVVAVAPEMAQSLGVRTAQVERRTLWRRIDTVGYVEYDRERLRHVYASAEGSIENLTVVSEGERVRKGQFLFEMESPRLSKHFGKFFAKQDGIVADLRVIEGTWALPTDIVMSIADLSSVWVLADVFENEAAWVREGRPAEVRLPAVADRVWEGKVQYIYPNLDPETRTLKVRLQFDNPDETLRPNMLAEVTIYGGPKPDVLAIPREALIETGKAQRVVVAEGEGRFRSREVSIGVERGGWVEVLSGIEEGERVVVSGQFLIDSEASLQASLMRMSAPGEEAR